MAQTAQKKNTEKATKKEREGLSSSRSLERFQVDTTSRQTLQPSDYRSQTAQQSWTKTELDLADWLELSWFYPQGFEKQEIRETRTAYIVLGESIVYKFLKPELQHSQAVHDSAFSQIWRRACLEIQRNRELAPDLFLGIRVLRIIDGEPHWITELRSKNLDPSNPPMEADQVAIVMRRIPSNSTLAHLVACDEEIAYSHLEQIVKRLVRFHKRKQRDGMRTFYEREREVLKVTEDSATQGLEQFSRLYSSLFDPFSRAALPQARGFLNRTRAKCFEQFYERAQKGYVVSCHGALRAEHIGVCALADEGREVSLFGRSGKDEEVLEDVLFDLASLSADLEVRGFVELAREIEQQYFSAFPEVYDPLLFRYYLCAASVSRARELFEAGTSEYFSLATKFLSFSLRCALNLNQPFLIGVGGSFPDTRLDISQNLVDLLDGVRLSEDVQTTSVSGSSEVDADLNFNRVMREADSALALGRVVVLDLPLQRAEQRIACARLAQKYGLRHLLLKCTISTEERVAKALTSLRSVGVPIAAPQPLVSTRCSAWAPLPALKVNQTLLEPSLLQPDLSLFVLRELASRDSKKTKA